METHSDQIQTVARALRWYTGRSDVDAALSLALLATVAAEDLLGDKEPSLVAWTADGARHAIAVAGQRVIHAWVNEGEETGAATAYSRTDVLSVSATEISPHVSIGRNVEWEVSAWQVALRDGTELTIGGFDAHAIRDRATEFLRTLLPA